MDKVYGNVVGVVIQNNDPEMRGRIKVFIPNISANIYQNWDEDPTDKIFNFVDNPDVQKILEDLKQVLPWAEYAGPLFGGCASARYNNTTKSGVVSDTNSFNGQEQIEGNRPLTMYNNELAYPDAFSSTGKVGNKSVNPYAYQYIPSNYSNLARGTFSIPNVGAHVWVWFMGGDTNYPVYFASAYGQEDFKRIYTMSQKVGLEGKDASSQDYPATYENIDDNKEKSQGKVISSDAKTFRSKHVINTNKNSLEMVDTDGLEKLKFTQYSGSFLELNNESTIKLSTANDQTMILGDTFETHQKDKNEFIGGVKDLIIHGDYYEKIGNQNAENIKKIFEKYKIIHDIKTLFDVKRTNYYVTGTDEAFKGNVTSPYQNQGNGTYAICPVCNSIPYIQPIWFLNPLHNRICIPLPLPYPGFPCLSMFTPVLPPILAINGEVGFIKGRFCPLCNRDKNKYTYHAGHQLGKSASTLNGIWEPEKSKAADDKLGDLYKSTTPAILDLQSTLGEGGDKINNISRNFVLNVGLAMNDLQSYRVDSRGKLPSNSMYLALDGAILKPEPTPHVEHVDVDSLPGGDYIVTAGNKMKFLVGSNGINIKTFGPIEMYGSITNLTSEQMNIMAKHELFIDGGEMLSLRARHISLNPFEHNPVLVEGSLHVSGNSIVQGGMHIEGELSVQHITAPAQWYQTEDGGGLTMLLNTLPQIPPLPTCPPHVHPLILQLPDHKHYYLNLPIDLKLAKEEARDAMIQLGINDNKPVKAKPILYPNPLTGEIDFPFPIGGINLADAVSDSLIENGIPTETIDSIFGTLTSLNDTSSVDSAYDTFASDTDSIGNAINTKKNAIEILLADNIKKTQEATESVFLSDR